MAKPTASDVQPRGDISPEIAERRYIYNGEPTLPKAVNDFSSTGNRAVRKRRRSPLGKILLLLSVSILIVFYVWNKITVNRLLVEVNDLENQHQKLQTSNDLLRAEINRKASLERVAAMAGKMGLVYPKQQPVWFEVSADDLERFEQQ
jgi:cell division protein FtsL